MRIHRVRLQDVRGIDACEVEFDPHGITVVAAPNETGKSTLVDAIRIALNPGLRSRTQAKEVKGLEPVGRQVGSVVEVELSLGDHHLVMRRRYNRQPEDVLNIAAPASEQIVGDEAHDRLAEILSEHVDVGLLDALWLQQGRDLDALELGQTSLSARLDAASAGTSPGDGHTGGDDLLARVDRHHLTWFTPKGDERIELRRLDQQVEQRREHAEELGRRLADVESDSDELADIERTLPVVEHQLATELQPALEAAHQARRTLEALVTRRETLLARLEQATTVLDAAQAALERRQAAAEAIATLAERVTAMEQGLQPAAEELAALAERRRNAQSDARSGEESLRSARRDQEHAQWIVDVLEARERHARLEGRLTRAREVGAAASAAQAAVDASRVDDEVVASIREADAIVRTLTARVDAGAPTVRLRAATDLTGDVDGEAFELADGQSLERHVRERLHLSLDALHLEVMAGETADDVHERLVEARRDLADRCRRAGVADLDAAERELSGRRAHEETLRQRDLLLERELEGMTLAELADAVDESRARVDRLVARRPDREAASEGAGAGVDAAAGDGADAAVDVPTDVSGLDEARRVLDECVRATEAADLAHRQAVGDLQVVADLHEEARDAHDAERREFDALHRTLARDREQLEAERATSSDDDLARLVAEAQEAHDAARVALDEADAQLAELDPERVELVETAARNAHDAAREELARRRQRRIELTVRLATVGAEGLGEQCSDAQAELERAELDRQRERRRAAAARMLRDELHAARDEVHRAYRAPLRDRIVRMSSLLLGEDVDVELDDDLRIATRTRGGTTLRWHQLSAGAREQLAILTALAAAQLAGEDGVPFILDDALGYTDPQRMATLGALLGRTDGAQVIVLTCTPERFRTTGVHTVPLLTS